MELAAVSACGQDSFYVPYQYCLVTKAWREETAAKDWKFLGKETKKQQS